MGYVNEIFLKKLRHIIYRWKGLETCYSMIIFSKTMTETNTTTTFIVIKFLVFHTSRHEKWKGIFPSLQTLLTNSGFWDIILEKCLCIIGVGNFNYYHVFIFDRLESIFNVSFTISLNIKPFIENFQILTQFIQFHASISNCWIKCFITTNIRNFNFIYTFVFKCMKRFIMTISNTFTDFWTYLVIEWFIKLMIPYIVYLIFVQYTIDIEGRISLKWTFFPKRI